MLQSKPAKQLYCRVRSIDLTFPSNTAFSDTQHTVKGAALTSTARARAFTNIIREPPSCRAPPPPPQALLCTLLSEFTPVAHQVVFKAPTAETSLLTWHPGHFEEGNVAKATGRAIPGCDCPPAAHSCSESKQMCRRDVVKVQLG